MPIGNFPPHSAMLCPSCGTEVPDAVFCGSCGVKMPRTPEESPADPLKDALVSVVGSRYEVIRLLGRGGMAAVYLAREISLERLVAIKVLPPEIAITEEIRERFRREAKTAAKLTHPNIVPLYSFGDTDDMLYFVMGFVQGESLGEIMKRQGRIPEHTAREILSSIAGALEYAHKKGIVHRDIKPDNVLIDDESGKPMLTDFGIAKALAGGGTLTEVGSIVGTPAYMSPEQAAGERDIDGRSDLYSLGVMGYSMLAGHPPFDGDSVQAILAQHMTAEPAPLEDVADVPGKTAHAIHRCLAKDPADRWPSASAFQKEIAAGIVMTTDIPEELREFESYWSSKVPIGLWASVLATMASKLWDVPWEGGIPWFFVVLVTPLFIYLPVSRWKDELRPKGIDWETMRRVLWLQPKWWSLNYPLEFRRKPALWDRLPKMVKRVRYITSVGSLLMVGAGLPALLYVFGDPEMVLGRWAGGGLVPIYLLLAYQLVVRRRLKKLGASREEIDALMGRARYAWRAAIWKQPFLRALLGEETESLEAGIDQPDTPQGFADAIRRAAGQLGTPMREIAQDAREWAIRLAELAAASEEELSKLEGDVDRAELEKLEARIEKLTGSTSEHDLKMLELLEGQAELFRQLETRSRDAMARRDRVVELLRTLWLQVSNLRAQSAKDSFDTAEITGEIRSLCQDIERHVSAGQEAESLLKDGESEGSGERRAESG